MTEKQRRRGGNAVRTTQINFGRSPAFRELAAGLAKHFDCSVAAVMEEALDMLASGKGLALAIRVLAALAGVALLGLVVDAAIGAAGGYDMPGSAADDRHRG